MGIKGSRALAGFAAKSDAMRNVGRNLTRNLTLPSIFLGAMAGKTALDFDRSMNQVQVALKAPQDQMEGLRSLAVKMGQDTIFSANESAQAMLDLAKGGMTQAQIEGGALQTTMQLAAAGGQDLATSAKQASAAINTFGLAAKDSQVVADALAGAANASSADLSDLAMSFRMAGQGAVNAGLNVNETAGALALMADNGLIGSDAGTSLKTMLQRLVPQSDRAKDSMAALGLEFFKANGQTKSLREIAGQLQQAFKGLSDEQRSAAMHTIFGSDATRAASILMRSGADGVGKYIKATKEQGAAQKMANAQMKGLAGAWEQLKGSLETAALALGEALTPTLLTLAGALKGVADWFTALPSGVQKFAAGLLFASAAAGPFVSALGFMGKGIGYLLVGLPKAIQFFSIWINGMKAGQGVLGGLSIATQAFGLSLRAAMIGTGIGALIAVLVILETKFGLVSKAVEWVKRAAVNVFNWIKSNWKLLAAILGGPFGLAVKFILDHIDTIKGWFNSFPDWLKNALGAIFKVITWPFRTALEFIIDKIKWAFDRIEDLKNALDSIIPDLNVGQRELTPEEIAAAGPDPRGHGAAAVTPQGGPDRGGGANRNKVNRFPRAAMQAGKQVHHTTRIMLDGRQIAESTVMNLEREAARA